MIVFLDYIVYLKENITVPVLYALYEDTGGSWRIQAVPVDPNSFASRKKLPTDWCGLRDEQLSEKTGIPGGIFIHASGFIGGHATREGAIKMAVQVMPVINILSLDRTCVEDYCSTGFIAVIRLQEACIVMEISHSL